MFRWLFYRFCRYDWDEAKRIANIAKHGLDFNIAPLVFRDVNHIEQPDKRFDYGEKRYQAIGKIKDRRACVIFTKRLFKRRIISARFVHEREWGKFYGKT
jgi:uncharacterized DUF497 family protein